MSRRAPIWPLVAGLEAENALGMPVKTQLGVRAFMEFSHALNMEAQGKIELLVGKRPEELAKPRDIKAEPVAPPPDLDSVVDEEPERRPALKPKPRATKKAAPRRTYKRRDIKAEN